jgi:hypothetical protein
LSRNELTRQDEPTPRADFRYWREHARSLRLLAAFEGRFFTLQANPPVRIWAVVVDGDFFAVAGGAPQIG